MKRAVLVLLVGIVVCVVLVACSTTRTATFDSYVMTKRGTTDWEPSTYEKKGTAIVTLADGTTAEAACPIEGLDKGATVTLKKNGDGTWEVTGKQ